MLKVVEAIAAVLSILKSFAPWIISGISILITIIFRNSAAKAKKESAINKKIATESTHTLKQYVNLSNKISELDKKHKKELQNVEKKGSSSRDFFESDW